MSRVFKDTKYKIHDRGISPDWFNDKLTDCIKKQLVEDPSYFERNENFDAYSSMEKQLGPWTSTAYRAAAMANYLQILAGYESSWDPKEGRDTTNPNEDTPWNEEAGIYQTSADSITTRKMRDLFTKYANMPFALTDEVANKFISLSKENFEYCTLHTILVLRQTIRHHGPASSRAVNKWLKKEAVLEFQKFITEGGSVEVPASLTPWVDIARGELGVHENNPGSNPRIVEYHSVTTLHATDDNTAWCSSFVSWCLQKAGYSHTHNAWAQSYGLYGEKLKGPKIGCIVPFRWSSTSGHVGFCVGFGDGYVDLLGGNQSHSSGGTVSIKRFSTDHVLGYRWPVK